MIPVSDPRERAVITNAVLSRASSNPVQPDSDGRFVRLGQYPVAIPHGLPRVWARLPDRVEPIWKFQPPVLAMS
jgi:hypothetical protein